MISVMSASSQPPPSACPLTAEMMGFRIVGIVDDHAAMKFELETSEKERSFISLISAPAVHERLVSMLAPETAPQQV